ncbi:hypothetical protein ACNPQM_21540 [Streptomyces sp. NPDC056231]
MADGGINPDDAAQHQALEDLAADMVTAATSSTGSTTTSPTACG